MGCLFISQISRRWWSARISGGGWRMRLGVMGAGDSAGWSIGCWTNNWTIGSGAASIWSASCFSTRLNLTAWALLQGLDCFSSWQQQECFLAWAVAQWQKTVRLAAKATSIRSALRRMG